MPRPRLLALFSFALLGACRPTERPDGGQGLLEVGHAAPALQDTTYDGRVVDLAQLAQPTLVYFYPKDDTPGCTKEACAFRDVWKRYEAAGIQVVGVSGDDDESHRKFAEEHDLPFPLVSDTDGAWAQSFGVAQLGGMSKRVSFLLDAQGKIVKVYGDVDPGVHADEVLADAAELLPGA